MNIILKHKYITFFLLGIFNALPFVYESLSLTSWFSFSLFLLFLFKTLNDKHIFVCITVFYFAYYFLTYSFFISLYPLTFVGIGYIPSLFILLFAWLIMSVVYSLIASLSTYFSLKLSQNYIIRIINISLAFLLVEYIESVGPLAFPWARLSLPQYNTPVLIQSASLFGPYFIDFLILLCNSLIAIFFLSQKKKFISASIFVFVFCANLLFGILSMHITEQKTKEAEVMLVQGNVLTDAKWEGESSYSIYMKNTLVDYENADIVVWSETAIPTQLNQSKIISNQLVSFSSSMSTEMIVGAFYSDEYGKVYNGAYHINKDGISDNIYFKRRLVPFGEYLPLGSLLKQLPFLDDINILSSDLNPGNSTAIMNTEKGKVGTLICFDSIFQTLAKETVSDGAEILAVITNDSWYKDYPAVYQHNAQSVWRAVENGRWVIRCANSGVSSIINNHGETVSYLPPLTSGTISEKVNFITDKTLYTQIGDIFIVPIFLYFIVLVLLKKKSALIKKH